MKEPPLKIFEKFRLIFKEVMAAKVRCDNDTVQRNDRVMSMRKQVVFLKPRGKGHRNLS